VSDITSPSCPVPQQPGETIQMAHGGGGRLGGRLVRELFATAFANPLLDPLHDGARLDVGGARLAFATDSHVVTPLFFPGGDIGSLAVHGTVNDLAMCGAQPLMLSTGFILEEGLPIDTLRRIVASMAAAANSVGVPIATGDTKVVDRGKGDGVYINTSGVGLVPDGVRIAPERAQPGDVILLSGEIAAHGMAILSLREGLGFTTELESDSAPLHSLVAAALSGAPEPGDVHVLRDPTRGGVGAALQEIASSAGIGVEIDEAAIPVAAAARGACEVLGLDPLYVANEGKCLLIVARSAAEPILSALRAHPLGRRAVQIGRVTDGPPGQVLVRTPFGGGRLLDLPSGEQLPRIC